MVKTPRRGDTGSADKTEKTRPYRMRARKAAVERTRKAILLSAVSLWSETPYDEITLDAVAAGAEVTRQTVIRHYGSKDDLFIAVSEWVYSRIEDQVAECEPGDVDAAVRILIDRWETMGNTIIKNLELEGRFRAIDHALAEGRAAQRAWLDKVFDPQLSTLPKGADREVVLDALYAAADVTVWKLFRHDFGRSKEGTKAAMRLLIESVLAGIPGPTTSRR